MAGTSLLALLDDIATVLDDIALMTKVAAKKTAGVLGDDLALNAEQVSGIRAERELPVVWAVAKGSLRNKLILVPAALILSALMPWAISPLLMLGGAYLCFEGFEKIVHQLVKGAHEGQSEHAVKLGAQSDPNLDLVAYEKEKIKGAIRTDMILSAEIIVIALGTVQESSMMVQVVVVSAIALLITVGVYSLVGGIVKLDDVGLHLLTKDGSGSWGRVRRLLGKGLLRLAPWLMKALSIVGTAAMFMVGGGILMHGMTAGEALTHRLEQIAGLLPLVGGLLSTLAPAFLNVLVGLLAAVSLYKKALAK